MWLTLCGSDRIRVRSTDFRDIYCFEFPKENGGKENENIFFPDYQSCRMLVATLTMMHISSERTNLSFRVGSLRSNSRAGPGGAKPVSINRDYAVQEKDTNLIQALTVLRSKKHLNRDIGSIYILIVLNLVKGLVSCGDVGD